MSHETVPALRLVVSIAEAARAIDISRSGFYDLVARGEIPTVSIGRRRLVRVRDLDAYIDRLAAEQAAVDDLGGDAA